MDAKKTALGYSWTHSHTLSDPVVTGTQYQHFFIYLLAWGTMTFSHFSQTSYYNDVSLLIHAWIKVLRRYDRFPSFKLHRDDL